ncbi:hypothetical protein HanXRQr2_Chr09g0376571 [Helianthus annuus]|uniref:Uncharacterized protein n=1 Tax=Helianthus annuus TaxID=4232 RepID=A0A9K3N775_HELAN|nr:hypothetical protein HanXRQr2_Chr09g0376571 [Helianthus annuus]KAJ0892196.1 hypothetical protein HanPSC8_Chr09g0363021 [Helianthus annuus]
MITNTVVPTDLITSSALPRFTRSNLIIRSFQSGFLNKSNSIVTISMKRTAKNRPVSQIISSSCLSLSSVPLNEERWSFWLR